MNCLVICERRGSYSGACQAAEWPIVLAAALRVPSNPICMGDILEYAPEGTLKFMPPVENPDYQIRAIKIGGILIADRNLVFLISWDDLDKQGFC